MSDTTIQWTDKTWNPVTGCDKVSPGCAHCYAEGVAARFWPSQYPPVEYETYSVDACCPITEMRARTFTDVQTHEDRLSQPLKWRQPVRVFVNSMSDLFHEDVPDAFIAQVFNVMAQCPRHTFQILTKRPARMAVLMNGPKRHDQWTPQMWHREVLSNVWLGVSVENQHFADERIPLLMQTPAAVRFLSCEPLLEGLDIAKHRPGANRLWVIVGGESGPKSRPCEVRWIRSVVRQCQEADVPVFVKQLGAKVIYRNDQGAPVRVRLADRAGGDMAEWPADLRVREFPRLALTRGTGPA